MCALLLRLALVCLTVSYPEDYCARKRTCRTIYERIGVCYWTLLPRVYLNWYKAELYSDPATEKSQQAFPMTTSRGVGKIPANSAVLGPVVEEGSQTYRILKCGGLSRAGFRSPGRSQYSGPQVLHLGELHKYLLGTLLISVAGGKGVTSHLRRRLQLFTHRCQTIPSCCNDEAVFHGE